MFNPPEYCNSIFTQKELSRRFGVALKYIMDHNLALSSHTLCDSIRYKSRNYPAALRGEGKPSWETLALLCEIYPISIEWLMLSRGPMVMLDSDRMPLNLHDTKYRNEDIFSNGLERRFFRSSHDVFYTLVRLRDIDIMQYSNLVNDLKLALKKASEELMTDKFDSLINRDIDYRTSIHERI